MDALNKIYIVIQLFETFQCFYSQLKMLILKFGIKILVVFLGFEM